MQRESHFAKRINPCVNSKGVVSAWLRLDFSRRSAFMLSRVGSGDARDVFPLNGIVVVDSRTFTTPIAAKDERRAACIGNAQWHGRAGRAIERNRTRTFSKF